MSVVHVAGWIVLALVALAIVGASLGFSRRRVVNWFHRREFQTAKADFKRRRETLEAKFFDLAGRQGKPRGLRWAEIDWLDSVTFARDRQSGLLTAFAGIEVHFEALPDGDMVDVEAVSNIRDAAAVFHYQQGVWGTGGRALFNMNPTDALVRLQNQYDPVI